MTHQISRLRHAKRVIAERLPVPLACIMRYLRLIMPDAPNASTSRRMGGITGIVPNHRYRPVCGAQGAITCKNTIAMAVNISGTPQREFGDRGQRHYRPKCQIDRDIDVVKHFSVG